MVGQIYPSELQLNKTNSSDTEAPFLDLHLPISYGFVSSKIYDKRDAVDFVIVNFPFLDRDIFRVTSYGVYIPSKNKKYPLFLSKSQRMHFSISVNVTFCDLRDIGGQYARKIGDQVSADMRVILARPVFCNPNNTLVLRTPKS